MKQEDIFEKQNEKRRKHMAKKMMACKAAPEIEIAIEGEENSVLLRFDIQCISNIQELEGGLQGLMTMKFAEMAATLLFCAAKDNNQEFTMEKAKKIIAFMSIDDVKEIINEFSASIGVKEGDDEATKKMIAQLLGK